jgi:uncharacterized protein
MITVYLLNQLLLMNNRVEKLRTDIEELYKTHQEYLLFHGWHHIWFVTEHAKNFAPLVDADIEIVEAAALVHDLNYIVEKNSEPEVAQAMRAKILTKAGFNESQVQHIELIITEAHTAHRNNDISPEGKALSDADTLFKSLPITPILFAGKFIQETGMNISKLAEKITEEQRPLLEQNMYFYIDEVRDRYQSWAQTNLDLWSAVGDCMQDETTQEMLRLAGMEKNVGE